MIKRFVSATQASLCCVMLTERVVSDLHNVILLYLDTMVEIDQLLLTPQWMPNNEEVNKNENRDCAMEDLMASTSEPMTSNRGKKKQPNLVKLNSLGLLVAASTHSYHGPAMLHWEGGWQGEQKIQQVKQLLHIKQSNADWQTITLCWLYQHETIQRLLEDSMKEENMDNQKTSKMEGVLKEYGSPQIATDAILDSQPIAAVLADNDKLYIPYCPVGHDNTT